MSSQASFGSSMLFQTMNEDLNASMATADELSREFNSLLQEVSPSTEPVSQTDSVIPRERPKPVSLSSSSTSSDEKTKGSSSSMPYSPSSTQPDPGLRSLDTNISNSKNRPSSPFSPHQLTPPQAHRERYSSSHHSGSDSSYTYGQLSPNQSPRIQRRLSPSSLQSRSPHSLSYIEPSPSPTPHVVSYDQSSRAMLHPSSTMLSPYDSNQKGRRSPRPDRCPSPRPFSQPASSTLPRNFVPFRLADEGVQRQKNPAKWNETDLDMSYERKPYHTYDKTDWLRPSVPKNSNWKESNLDGPPSTSKKDSLLHSLQSSHASLPRHIRISVPPEHASPTQSSYHSQPIISRISIPPSSPQTRQHRPIPLSVIMRLQNPHWATAATGYPRAMEGEGDMGLYRQPIPLPREYLPQPPPPELRQPAYYGEVLKPGDVDAELDLQHGPAVSESPISERGREKERGDRKQAAAPRPLSPTRLQPVVAPQSQQIHNLEELLRLRADIPRALKRRGSVEQSQPLKKAAVLQPNQYKQIINKLFRRKGPHHKGELGNETSSSSEGEESSIPPSPVPAPLTHTSLSLDLRGHQSILRSPSREFKGSGRRARLSPLVLLLDGSLLGELDTVQRAVQEMSDPSQPNDEGITALHNAICGGHYTVVEFLVRIGANVSAPDSHGWTPLHCAASCNDRPLCEFLVRNGAAVMAVTESDGATASQKCDPYAMGFEECESFLKGVEEAMGVENSGVLYALWGYPAQATDELSFREGDMVTILQKPEGVDWWWASLCGREGFVPNNYFGLFPKVRPKSLC